jgi:pimeloyl-ACP methyl ester carboxylesterase
MPGIQVEVEVAAGRLPVQLDGPADGRTAVLLHGFPQSGRCWSAVVPLLHTAGARTAVVLQRGYAATARPDRVEDYRLPNLVTDALTVMEQVGGQGPILVGHDWGAIVGWGLAAEYPDRIAALVAVSVPHPAAFQRARDTDPDQRSRSAYIGLFRQPGKAERVLTEDGGRRLRAMFTGLDADTTEAYVAPLLDDPGMLTGALNWYRAMASGDFALPTVKVPTTYLWSDGDDAIGPVAAAACHDYVRGPWRTVTLPGVSHWIPDQAPDAIADAVSAYLG